MKEYGPGAAFLFHKPFTCFYSAEIETLPPLEEAFPRGREEVFEEREGLLFIKPAVLSPGAEDESRLDRDFKSLVDSLIDLN